MTRRLATPHGHCVVLAVGDDELDAALAALPAAERAHAGTLGPARRRDFIAGRTALHAALDHQLDHQPGDAPAILGDDRGAPLLPAGWTGSVSHKGAFAAALVERAADGAWIGIDLEHAAPPRRDIAGRILTPRELAALPDRGRPVTLRFALKEAIYKAIAPHLRRYVGFLEVELDVDDAAPDSGRVVVTSALPFAIEATWTEHAGHWLATARARLR